MATDARRAAATTRLAWIALVAMLGGCAGGGGANLQQLLGSLSIPAVGAGPTETGAIAAAPAAELPAGPHETSLFVAGTPTGVFAQVARGALGCWFAADGPLKATHVYRAEAQPPARGGDAEISIHERDATVRDLRGPRVYKISFTAESTGVRVATIAMKHELKVAEAMARDVAVWAKGGEGCQLRKVLTPPVPAPSAAVSKGSKSPKFPTKAAKTVKPTKAAAAKTASPSARTTR